MSIYFGSVLGRSNLVLAFGLISTLAACTPAATPTVLDSDGDGLLDTFECVDSARCADTDDDGTPDYQDSDDDNDGTPTADELSSSGEVIDTDMDGTANHADTDDDEDGILSALENLDGVAAGQDPDDDDKRNALDTDSDGDSMSDMLEGRGDEDGDGAPNYLDATSSPADQDGDGIPDRVECVDPATVASCADSDGDGTPDLQDSDDDGDGIDTSEELGSGAAPRDTDDDGTPDYRDRDDDGDTIATADEIAASTGSVGDDVDDDDLVNWLDADANGNGIGDAVEGAGDTNDNGIPDYLDGGSAPVDSDRDGLPDTTECADPTVPTACADTDEDGIPDFLDADDDGDGINTSLELTAMAHRDTDGDGVPDHRDSDDDGDSLDTSDEGSSLDTDSDGVLNYRDNDDDDDGIPTEREVTDGLAHGNDVDDDGAVNWLDVNSDGDAFDDADEARADTDDDGVPEYLDTTTAAGCAGAIEICGNSIDDDCDGDIDEASFCDVASLIDVAAAPAGAEFGYAWDPSDVSIELALNSGVTGTLECRTGRVNASGNVDGSFTACPSGAFTPDVDITTTGDGLYKTQVRVRRSAEDVTDSLSISYYLHSSLVDAPDCELEPAHDAFFTEALNSLPVTGTFDPDAATDAPGFVQLSNPFVRVNFAPPFNRYFNFGARLDGGGWEPRDGQTTMLSLRHRFVMNEAHNLLLVYRRYASRRIMAGSGSTMCNAMMDFVHNGRNNEDDHYCDAVVLNTRGAGVCLRQSGSDAVTETTTTQWVSELISGLLPADEALTDGVDNALWRKLSYFNSPNATYIDASVNRFQCLITRNPDYCNFYGYSGASTPRFFSPKCYGDARCVDALASSDITRYPGPGFAPLFLPDHTFYRF